MRCEKVIAAFLSVTLRGKRTNILRNVRYWHKADIPRCTTHVCFRVQSGHDFSQRKCLLLTQSGHPREIGLNQAFVREFLVTISRDRSFIPFNPDARKVGNFEAAVLNSKWLFQDGTGPILPLQPVRGFGHAHQVRRNFRI